MVRVFIRNGACGVERFFKLFGAESKAEVFLTCVEKEAMTFRELSERLIDSVDTPTLTKRLTEFTKQGVLEKLNYTEDSKIVYRITQKGADILPILEHMRAFYIQWFHRESPETFYWVTYAKRTLGSRWSARIIWLLFVLRSVRFNDIKNSIEGISFKMLTQQLRYLEAENVVLRTDYQTNPPRVEYSLTPKGEALYEILLGIANWDVHYNRKGNDGDQENCGLELSI